MEFDVMYVEGLKGYNGWEVFIACLHALLWFPIVFPPPPPATNIFPSSTRARSLAFPAAHPTAPWRRKLMVFGSYWEH